MIGLDGVLFDEDWEVMKGSIFIVSSIVNNNGVIWTHPSIVGSWRAEL